MVARIATPVDGHGVDAKSRAELAEVERRRVQVDADYDRPQGV